MSTAEHLDDDDSNAFAITSPLEVVSVLRSIVDQRRLVRMQVDDQEIAFVTRLLAVDHEENTLVIDNAARNAVNLSVMHASKILFETSLDQVLVRFFASNITSCVLGSGDALSMDIPDRLIRLQRREHYRIDIPIQEPVFCTIPEPWAETCVPVAVSIENISCGGIAIFDDGNHLDHTVNTVYTNCSIDFPEIGRVAVTLKVIHVQEPQPLSERKGHRLGCSFIDADGPTIKMIQFYIGQLEREQIANRRGFND